MPVRKLETDNLTLLSEGVIKTEFFLRVSLSYMLQEKVKFILKSLN